MKVLIEKNILVKALDKFITAWDNFWFTPMSTLPIDIFRILLGLVFMQMAFLLLPDIYVWFGKNGIISSTTVQGWQADVRLNILNLFAGDDLWLNIVFAVFTISAMTLTVGILTRFSAILVFVCLSSFHARNCMIFNGGDVFMRMLCFWLIFSAAGKSLSVDSFGRKNNSAKHSQLVSLQTSNDNESMASPWAQRLMQINMCFVYAQSFMAKIVGSDWQSGVAVYFSSRMTDMKHFPLPYLFDHLWSCKLLSWAVLTIEFSLFTLIWFKPIRYYVIVLGIFMHLMIDWTMNIPQFEWIMIFSYILFIEPADIDKVFKWFKQIVMKLSNRLHFSQILF